MMMMMMTMSQIQYRPSYLYVAPWKAVVTTQIKLPNKALSEMMMMTVTLVVVTMTMLTMLMKIKMGMLTMTYI